MTGSPRSFLKRISSPQSTTRSRKPRFYREGHGCGAQLQVPRPVPRATVENKMLSPKERTPRHPWHERRTARTPHPRPPKDLYNRVQQGTRTANGSPKPAPTTWVPPVPKGLTLYFSCVRFAPRCQLSPPLREPSTCTMLLMTNFNILSRSGTS